ncbi:P-loop containing nucleoside triphosphate hydrolase protein [Daedalea quercina L-15889]|uniref:p-loop containing nucleoside triphosphate hydrolase protein n=1 Tax=Daedalea quercina L-15889 TaxID=1314783 RepID=A0A165PXP1_9APHY|nr:P-loop containing nucleoside triphosphate hydrolase protein [Daedalea quercina L-15889]
METPTLTDSVKYVIHNKALIQQHMAQHRSTWQPEQSASTLHANSSLVETFIRVRPLLDKDHACGAFSLIDVQEPRTLHFTQPLVRALGGRFSTKSFKASSVFGSEVDNDAVYNGMRVPHAVQECLAFKTRELSILAYGQTGTGKTYSTTALEDRVVQQIWTAVKQDSHHSVFIEAFEIRGNAAFDLLSDPPLAPVKVLVTGASDVQYSGLSRHEAPSLPDLLDYIGRAKDLRLTRSTVKNSASSRSHSIIRLHICWKETS